VKWLFAIFLAAAVNARRKIARAWETLCSITAFTHMIDMKKTAFEGHQHVRVLFGFLVLCLFLGSLLGDHWVTTLSSRIGGIAACLLD
jgi:hypothetical protein